MKRLIALLLLLLFFDAVAQKKIDVNKQLDLALQQYERMLINHPDTNKTPFTLNPDGSYKDMNTGWWCSGFFGGTLWYLFEYTKEDKWKDAADRWTMAVQREQHNTRTHDLGFMIYNPFGNGYRLTGNPVYKEIMLTGARSLATRFDPARGVIKSWEKYGEFEFPVIIDNMMNLEFLFWAAKNSGDKRFYDISVNHANRTIKNHFRADHSSYHMVCYGPNGEVLAKKTVQGYRDSSTWARGHAWGIYGYTVMYRETKDKKYLTQAQRMADFYLDHQNLPADKIPYWDFNAPGIPNEERDASAAAITASALLELSSFSNGKKKKKYFHMAEEMLGSLCSSSYRNETGEQGNFLIKHCVGHKPAKTEVDVPLVYADYYFVEALLRYKRLID